MSERGLCESGRLEFTQDTRSDSFSAETEGKEERIGTEVCIYRQRRKLREFCPDGVMSIL